MRRGQAATTSRGLARAGTEWLLLGWWGESCRCGAIICLYQETCLRCLSGENKQFILIGRAFATGPLLQYCIRFLFYRIGEITLRLVTMERQLISKQSKRHPGSDFQLSLAALPKTPYGTDKAPISSRGGSPVFSSKPHLGKGSFSLFLGVPLFDVPDGVKAFAQTWFNFNRTCCTSL